MTTNNDNAINQMAVAPTQSAHFRPTSAPHETTEPDTPRLLVLSCSRRKRTDDAPLPAIERYNGPAFQVVRRFLRQLPAQSLDIQIVSARAGLIAATTPVPYYDQRMTRSQALALQNQVTTALASLIQNHHYQDVCFCMGKDYALTLNGYHEHMPPATRVTTIHGTMGTMLAHLYDWLYGCPPPPPSPPPEETARPTRVRFRGGDITLTAAQVMERGRQALREGAGNPSHFQAWYVEIDGQRVAPKWLVGVLTGRPVSMFTSGEARRVLAQLGVPTYRL